MTHLLLLLSHAVVALAFYQMGRTDEMLDPEDDRIVPRFRRRTDPPNTQP